ncbi:GNAT family N-acetyltransferase [Agrobacterium rubi]|uniref:GNAT family N-acetyltransferase n=1 Tax=Agrobacterium rubi TaxID=28099 RepID=A0AAE7R6U6_9HYPH|nr:GNAT family N-acetyltransferase [Agrobacterium rubi]NTE88911.1 GNAT family N-acetyltransferase [Agrobacterium rubi]NTF04739.1 GNAT family N-acetyltransferase [Agrobacterium rubi]NTF10263.1 GNAT family N-acetyltransferase [Agrobacterium rubi]NTF21559.1 GNAT family N-acetyltransferase [Agrobacterium rubi]NTF28416.1 GNAT family N-acetyltransferase [Agrobacterium rubi]
MASDPNDPDMRDDRFARLIAKTVPDRPAADSSVRVGRAGREFCIYPAQLGYDLQEELDFLSNRVVEPNIFFTGKLLAPAMPRVDNRAVRFALMRDENGARSRMRFLMPFTIEKPGFSVGPSILRAWSNPFGPLGTPLVDSEGAAETIDNLLDALSQPELRLPDVLVLPTLRLDGAFTRMIKAIALSRNLPLAIAEPHRRMMLESETDASLYLQNNLSAGQLQELETHWQHLKSVGTLTHDIARQPQDIRLRTEEFLALEASGSKGRKRSALVSDRYRAAFAREAITNLAEIDAVRIHTVNLNGQAIASAVVFMTMGEAYVWKLAVNENHSRHAIERLLMQKLTEWHLDDANILRTDSCGADEDGSLKGFWSESAEMGTLVIGLSQNSDRDVRQVAAQVHMYRNTRNLAKVLRERIMSLGRKSTAGN